MKCTGEQPTESDPTGCTGCDAQEEWCDKRYSEHMIDEVSYKEFISKDELFAWIDTELKYKDLQLTDFNKGYFHALNKLKSMIKEPSINI